MTWENTASVLETLYAEYGTLYNREVIHEKL
jgi:hypothetical protein